MSVFGPDPFIHGIREMRRLFRQDGPRPFGRLVFGELAFFLDDLGVVHGNERVLAFVAVEPDGREGRITSFQDVPPKEVLIMLRGFLSFMDLLDHTPPCPLEPGDCLIIVGAGPVDVGVPGIAVAVPVKDDEFVLMVPVVFRKLIHQ